jgi:hypothetical protein
VSGKTPKVPATDFKKLALPAEDPSHYEKIRIEYGITVLAALVNLAPKMPHQLIY